jgi:hypothetical protein
MSDDITLPPAPEPDPLAELLAPPTGPDPVALRRRLREQTVRLLRRRRLWRYLAVAAAVAAAFLLGLLLPRPGARPPAPAPETTSRPDQPPAPEKGPAPADAPSAVALEWRAFDNTDASLYRQAGERYLREDGDPLAAARCYRQSLDAAGPDALAVTADDDWLLMAIKDARQREKHDAKPF